MHMLRWKKRFATVCAMGLCLQLGPCNLGEITTVTTTTLNGRDVIISLVRAAIITPLDQILTNFVANAVDNLTNDE